MAKKKAPLRLNLGCGTNRIEGFINIDVEPSCKPDVICNFMAGKLPYKAGTVEEVVLFHCIEHIKKSLHRHILEEVWRVLKPSGKFIVSYPEFLKCVDNWKKNHRGKKEFWEHTIYGRQLYPSDFHVCIMHTPEFTNVLKAYGFNVTKSCQEPLEPHNSIVYATKIVKPMNYEQQVGEHRQTYTIVKAKRIKL
jgi:predicted SAM-dependent methyltransferase